MPDSLTSLSTIRRDVLYATLDALGGELLENSGFEDEVPIDLDHEPIEGGEE